MAKKQADAARTTPFGLWRYGNDFCLAASYVLEHERSKFFMPYYFLLGQSIELSLKAFLLGRGNSLDELRKKYGHNLTALLLEASRRQLGREVKLKAIHGAGIRLLTLEYKPRKFQYIETGSMTLPEAWIIHEAAEQLSRGLECFCRKHTKF